MCLYLCEMKYFKNGLFQESLVFNSMLIKHKKFRYKLYNNFTIFINFKLYRNKYNIFSIHKLQYNLNKKLLNNNSLLFRYFFDTLSNFLKLFCLKITNNFDSLIPFYYGYYRIYMHTFEY